MLHRFLFVAGMTVGVMVPLVWAAYVSRPASHAAKTPAAKVAEVASEAPMPTRTTPADVTASIPPAPPVASAPPHASQRSPSKLTAKTERSYSKPVVTTRRAKERILPAVVDSYNGAHIMTVCAALTAGEQLRAGCP